MRATNSLECSWRALLLAGGAIFALSPGCSDDTQTTTFDGKAGKEAGAAKEGGAHEGGGPGIDNAIGLKEGGTAKETGAKFEGGSGDTTCLPGMGASDACGGNLAGAWKYKSACTNTDVLALVKAYCAAATATTPVFAASGTLDISGTTSVLAFNRALTLTASSTVSVPTSCTLSAPCSTVSTAITAVLPTGSSATCSASSSGCSCAITVDLSLGGTGTLTSSGGIATVTLSAGTSQYYYCVNGNVLKYKGLASNATDKDFCYVLTL
jgi:hypothetical protein